MKALYDRDTRLAQRLEDRGGETPVIDVQMGEIERAVPGDQPPQVPARLRIVQEPPELRDGRTAGIDGGREIGAVAVRQVVVMRRREKDAVMPGPSSIRAVLKYTLSEPPRT